MICDGRVMKIAAAAMGGGGGGGQMKCWWWSAVVQPTAGGDELVKADVDDGVGLGVMDGENGWVTMIAMLMMVIGVNVC